MLMTLLQNVRKCAFGALFARAANNFKIIYEKVLTNTPICGIIIMSEGESKS